MKLALIAFRRRIRARHAGVRKRRKRGVSLLEAMIAMTVMAVSITGIMTAFSASLVSGADAERLSEAILVLEMLDAQLRMGEFSPLEQNSGLTQDEEFNWRVTFESTDQTDLYLVKLEIGWQRGQSKRSISATSLHYQTESTEPVL